MTDSERLYHEIMRLEGQLRLIHGAVLAVAVAAITFVAIWFILYI